MRYVSSKYKLYMHDMMYRIYMSDSIFYQAQEKRLDYRFIDKLFPRQEDTRTGDEIALEVISKLDLKVK